MPVSELFPGPRYGIDAWLDEEGSCAVQEFISELHEKGDSDAEALLYEIGKTAQHGISQNKQKFRYLQGTGAGLVEFKARGGSRVLGFIDVDRGRIICTHGIPKLKERRFEREMSKAQKIKNRYLLETLQEGHVN